MSDFNEIKQRTDKILASYSQYPWGAGKGIMIEGLDCLYAYKKKLTETEAKLAKAEHELGFYTSNRDNGERAREYFKQ